MKDTRIRINVGGTQFHCYRKTLDVFPNTRLARLTTSSDDFDDSNSEFFFDRNPLVFTFILEAYRTGSLHLPRDICGETIQEEMEFWELSPALLSGCCWKTYYKSESDVAVIKNLTANYFRKQDLCRRQSGRGLNAYRMKLWVFLDEPQSSKLAMGWGLLMMAAVFLSTLISVSETVHSLREPLRDDELAVMDEVKKLMGLVNSTDKEVIAFNTKPNTSLQYLDVSLFIILTIDLILRLCTCPCLKNFICNFIHISEIVCVIDFWVLFVMERNLHRLSGQAGAYLYLVAKTILIVKMIRIFKLGRYIPELKIIGLSMRDSKKIIAVLVSMLFTWILIFGYLAYMVEVFQNDNFPNAFMAMYWALITITTVGYGDVYPTTELGRCISCLCAVLGMIMLALPIGVIASSFKTLHSHYEYSEKHIKKYNLNCVNQRKDKQGTS